MDWFSWLARTSLEPCLVYEYGLTFNHNELEEEDIAYFNHEFLQSMGISIAKHRLEILKLAKKEREGRPHTITRVLVAIKRTKRRLKKCLKAWSSRREESALVVVPKPYSRWRGSAMLKRSKTLMVDKQERLLLTNGNPVVVAGYKSNAFSGPLVYNLGKDEKTLKGDKVDDYGYWTSTVEQFKWDSMFQNLNPT